MQGVSSPTDTDSTSCDNFHNSIMLGASSECREVGSLPLNILYFNARSLLPKIDELRALVEQKSPHIICIVESWLSESIEDNEISIGDYQIHRLDRNRHGGGILMYVHCSLSVKVLSCGFRNLELMIISVSLSHFVSNCCISLFYRQPSSKCDTFDNLCTALYSLDPSAFRNCFVLLGDFNINYFCTSSFLYRRLLSCMSPFSLVQIVNSATHTNPQGRDSLIDLVFLSTPSLLNFCNTIPPLASSDHNGIDLQISTSVTSLPPQDEGSQREIWRYDLADFDRANDLIISTDWEDLMAEGMDVSLAKWQDKFMEIMVQCIPKVRLPKRKNFPWLTKKILQAMRKRNTLFRKAKTTGDNRVYQKYKKCRNNVNLHATSC